MKARCIRLLIVLMTPNGFAQDSYDLVVYGGASAGVIAAVQAKMPGKSAVIVGPDKHLGGPTGGGLGWTDPGNKVPPSSGSTNLRMFQSVSSHSGNGI